LADIIALDEEPAPAGDEIEIFDPNAIWKRKTVTNFYAKNLREQIFKGGKLVYDLPELNDIKQYCKEQLDLMWDEMKRFDNPQTYYVDLSNELWNLKNKMIEDAR
ncbi:MAG: nicotinate phosphoribosyltransferase, partial [Firmicutes bacterium]|nr:nicotinate phosphoribosyltransferase [Bacillota bacterium]